MQIISRFEPAQAGPAHGGTILASEVLPEGLAAPFSHAWGYLNGPGEMEPHTHYKEEVYLFIRGEGFVVVDGQRYPVRSGDVAYVPPGALHSVANEARGELLWAAFWWPVLEEGTTV